MLHIEFYGADGVPLRCELPEFTDKAIDRARAILEGNSGQTFEVNPVTGFPTFIITRDGDQVGGG